MEREPANHDVRFGSGDDGREQGGRHESTAQEVTVLLLLCAAQFGTIDFIHSFVPARAHARLAWKDTAENG